MLLEGLAARLPPPQPLAAGWRIEEGVLDLRPLLASLLQPADRAMAAAQFHSTLAAALVDWVTQAATQQAIRTVAAAGGCLLNRLLVNALQAGLQARGLRLLLAQQLPPNDGGLALGQAWVVRQRAAAVRA
jgi:hydrogenase maturation protein HypF